jgi:hypothetical protein
MKDAIGTAVQFKGSEVTVTGYKDGWFALSNGKKARAKDIGLAAAPTPKTVPTGSIAAELANTHSTTTKEKTVQTQTSTNSKTRKPPVKAKAPRKAKAKVVTGNVIPEKYASQYVVRDDKTPSGRKVVDCDDSVARHLKGMPLEDIYRFAAKASDTTITALKAQYAKLNAGMQRMNLGNRIRRAVNAGEMKVSDLKA